MWLIYIDTALSLDGNKKFARIKIGFFPKEI